MPHFFKSLTGSTWIKRHPFESSEPPCALGSCSRPRSLWQRLRRRHRPEGTFLQGLFYCRPQCLETALLGQLSRLRGMAPSPPPPNRIPLGLLMVARGKLTYLEVRAALEAQRRARYGKIGEWIEKLGFASEQEVTTALGLQWGCPVASSFDPSTIHSPGSIPLPILEAFQMLPLNYVASTNTLYLAFGERVDHAALYAIEKNPRLPHPALRCRTQKYRPPTRRHAPVTPPQRRGIRTHEQSVRNGAHCLQLHRPADSRKSSPQPHRTFHLAPP